MSTVTTPADEQAQRVADRAAKRERMRGLLERAGARGVLLTSHEAVAWYLDGPRTHVSLAGPPVLAVVVHPERDIVYAPRNEADRLVAEELLPEDAEALVRVPWHEPLEQAARRAAADDALPLGAGHAALSEAGGALPLEARHDGLLPEAALAAELRAARASLLPGELARYRALGAETARALGDVARAARPGDSERATAAELQAALASRGIDPLVALVAGSARLPHRHPLPTGAILGDRAMLVVCGRRHGLIANATRWLTTGEADDEREARIRSVEAAYLDATVPGATLDAVLAAGIDGYAAASFDAEEWRQHHQGGPTGYAGRDPRATPGAADLVQERHAFAWNPSAPGCKVEDTVVAGSAGIEVLTVEPAWPTATTAGRERPLPLRY
ncbi:MAG: M24 family metallopeptidase [Microbacteriaceae bacterium]